MKYPILTCPFLRCFFLGALISLVVNFKPLLQLLQDTLHLWGVNTNVKNTSYFALFCPVLRFFNCTNRLIWLLIKNLLKRLLELLSAFRILLNLNNSQHILWTRKTWPLLLFCICLIKKDTLI